MKEINKQPKLRKLFKHIRGVVAFFKQVELVVRHMVFLWHFVRKVFGIIADAFFDKLGRRGFAGAAVIPERLHLLGRQFESDGFVFDGFTFLLPHSFMHWVRAGKLVKF